MTLHNRVRRLSIALASCAVVAFAAPAFSQDISATHLQAARDAIEAIHATDAFDNILPQAASALQAQLIQKNPNLQKLIIETVSEKALALAPRRADLEKEAANVYAKVFSEDELKSIAAFYSSQAGKKLLEKGPLVSRDLVKAADIWQNGIARDLAKQVGESLAAAAAAAAPAKDAPATDAAPADGAN